MSGSITTRRPLLVASWVALAVVVVAGLAVGTLAADEPTPAERARDLAGQFACPRCDGQSVRESDAGISVEIRAEIRRRVDAGQSDEEILAFLDRSYPGNLLTPPASGTTSLVWAIPVALGVVSFAALALAFTRWRPHPPAEVDPDDRDLVARALRDRRGADDGGA